MSKKVQIVCLVANATVQEPQTAPKPQENVANDSLPSKETSARKINPFYKGPISSGTPSTSSSANANGCRTNDCKDNINIIQTPQDSNQHQSFIPQSSGKRLKPPAPCTSYLDQIGSGPIACVPKKEKHSQMLNPFNRMNQLKSSNKKKLQEKKQRAELIRQKNSNKKCETVVLELSEEEKEDENENENDDDDVIILPVQPDPVYSIDSSDNDQEEDESKDLQEAIKRSLLDKIQAGSNENSNASDDFIGPNDRCRVIRGYEDPFPEMDDENMSAINNSVEESANSNANIRSRDEITDAQNRVFASNYIQFVRSTDTGNDSVPADPIPSTSKQAEQMQNNEPIFAKPVQAQTTTKSYEVSENCIAAVDVYESESSDMPESVYSKGNKKNTEDAEPDKSDSDVSDVVVETVNRSKRLTKRKTSGSNKESDHVDTDESDNDTTTLIRNRMSHSSTPFIKRGLAINNVISMTPSNVIRKSKTNKPTKNTVVNSDEEFISMLSCVVHETNISAETQESSEQSNSKLNKSNDPWIVTDINAEETPVDKPAKENASWTVKDAVGEVDDQDMPYDIQLNVDEISNDSADRNLAERLQNLDPTEPIETAPCVNEKEIQKEKGVEDVPSRSLIVHPEIGWNEEMEYFYKKSWGGETFNAQQLRASMSNSHFEWTISNEDRFPRKTRFNKFYRCMNCREIGHRISDCGQPAREITCYMCGQKGHHEPRCPNAICLGCGAKTDVYLQNCRRCRNMRDVYCGLCRAHGHGPRDCPDKWRRYHSTTEPNTPLNKLFPLNKMPLSRNQENLYCCVCAGRGHTAEYCRSSYGLPDMKLALMKIASYEQCYSNVDADNSNTAPYALFSNPLQDFDFNWDVNEEPTRFYGRFMTATKFKRKPIETTPTAKKRRACLTANTKAKKKRLVFNPFSNMTETEVQSLKQKDLPRNEKTDDEEIDVGMEGNVEVEKNNAAELASKELNENEEIDVVSLDVKMEEPQSNIPKFVNEREIQNQENSDAKMIDEEIDVGEEPKYDDECKIDEESKEDKIEINESKMNEESKEDKIEINESKMNDESKNDFETKSESQKDDTERDSESSQIVFSFTKTLDEIESGRNSQKFDLSFIGKSPETGTVNPVSPIVSPIKYPSHQQQQQHRKVFPKRSVPAHRFEVTNINQVLPPDVTIVRPPRSNVYQKSQSMELNANSVRSLPMDNIVRATAQRSSISQQHHPSTNATAFQDQSRMPDYIPLSNNQMYLRNSANVHRFEDSTAMPDFIPLTGHHSISRSSISSTQSALAPLRPFNKAPIKLSAPPPPPQLQMTTFNDDDVQIIIDTTPTTNTNEPTSVISLSEEIKTNEKPCSAKIFLTKDNCKYLLNGKGSDFLRDESAKNDVSVTMEYGSYGNNLNIFGLPSKQNEFQKALAAFCKEAEDETKRKNEVSARVPKNRQTLMKFIQDQIVQLDRPLGNVKDLFVKMKISERLKTKQGTKTADKARKSLNMILIGQAGLLEGQMHLVALMGNLRYLKELSKDVVSVNFRNQVFLHCRYIFSSFDHKNYEKLINKYEEMRKSNQLPILNLDRKLLGFKLSVSSTSVDDLSFTEFADDILQMTGTSGDNIPDDIKLNNEDDIKLNISTDVVKIESIQKRTEDNEDDKNSFEQAKLKLQNALKVENKSQQEECKEEKEAEPVAVSVPVVDTPKTKPDRYERILDRISLKKKKNKREGKNCSEFWSQKCAELIEKCHTATKILSNPRAREKLKFVATKAENNKLSYSDYFVLMKFSDLVK